MQEAAYQDITFWYRKLSTIHHFIIHKELYEKNPKHLECKTIHLAREKKQGLSLGSVMANRNISTDNYKQS